MPYLQQEKLLFIHIPKTGGTSVEHFFSMCKPESLWFDRWDRDRDKFLYDHKYTLELEMKKEYEPQHYSYGILKKLIPDINKYYTFSFVRHPYTRLLSEYFWSLGMICEKESDFQPDHFHEWVCQFFTKIDFSHKETQTFFLDGRIDFIGRFEHLEEDMSKLLQQLCQFNPVFKKFTDQQLPLTNQSGKSKEKLVHLISMETKELIQSVYQDDFHAFGYSTDFV
jgi:hypothetical protein